MKYRYLGSSGLMVSRVCLGTMTFGNPEWGCDKGTSAEIVRGFLDAGGNFIDLYQIHGPDPHTGCEEKMKAMDDLVLQGKARYIGWSPLGGGMLTGK